MAASPKLLTALAVIVGLLTGVMAFLDHSTFLGGLLVGVGGVTTFVLAAIAIVRVKLESQMEEFASGMNIDINQLLGKGDPKA